ncbi:hypothetical protein [Brevibacterium sp. RIT 803]|uniref:hypothetical protein n=1 Tax=Brevibacterium sp. RIT 803 TaxID=2810210 RepID=UPI00194EFBCE|nr:hypothetical protein [Brevibacterium sp. RIT 803]MBM6588915.1 hypothetical protein [Brevibacterium sp. RIT 803]
MATESAIDQQEIDEKKAAQIRHLLAEENEEAVKRRFGEQEFNSPEYQQAKQELAQRGSARTEHFKAEIEEQGQIDREREAELARQKEAERQAQEQAVQEPETEQNQDQEVEQNQEAEPDHDRGQKRDRPELADAPRPEKQSTRDGKHRGGTESQRQDRVSSARRQVPETTGADTADQGDSQGHETQRPESTYERVARSQRESRERSTHGIDR